MPLLASTLAKWLAFYDAGPHSSSLKWAPSMNNASTRVIRLRHEVTESNRLRISFKHHMLIFRINCRLDSNPVECPTTQLAKVIEHQLNFDINALRKPPRWFHIMPLVTSGFGRVSKNWGIHVYLIQPQGGL